MSEESYPQDVAIEEIDATTIGQGRRIEEEAVATLMDSIRENGLLQRIGLTADYKLIYGAHRLIACQRLGWETVPAEIHDHLSGLRAELAQIDENVERHRLNALEWSRLLKRRKQIYEELHPEATAAAKKAGGGRKAHARPASADRAQAQAVAPQVDTANEPPTFVDDTAQRTGQARRTVQDDLAIATNISDKAAQLLLGTPLADNKAQLRRLARLPAKDQLKAAKRISTGKAETVQQALRPSSDGQDAKPAETLKRLKAALRTLTRELGVFGLYDKHATTLQQIHDDLEAIR